MPEAFILTLGCPKNEADSDAFAGCLTEAGWEITGNLEDTDLLLINTCAFIKPAVDESLEATQQALEWKNERPGRILILAGCLPGRYPDDGSGGLEDFDLIIAPGDTSRLEDYLSIQPASGPEPAGGRISRYLKISEGCSNNCAYCTIPLIRGARRDRSPEEILMDAERLAEQGVAEIGIVGQDTASWKRGRDGISWLISQLAGTYPDIWFRLYYIHPAYYPYDFLSLLAKHENVMPYIDMPVQHVSDRILERMGRPYTGDHIRKLFDEFENSEKMLSVRTTLIAGYPGETEEDFNELIEFLSRYRCIRTIAAFPYWPEEGTMEFSRHTAEDLADENIVQSRLARIGDAADEHNIIWADRLEGEIMDVLADTPLLGHSRLDAPEVDGACCFDRSVEPGRIIRCRITGGAGSDLTAEVLE
ncbi:MAG: MiaB/RimO family radical SAM methylthiotransferase [Candidatus Aegiribacteria sp.]|nr:MiaB/RimO family radical SAM methylthiotransferase [Candidatus Aegiribacteria sp.]